MADRNYFQKLLNRHSSAIVGFWNSYAERLTKIYFLRTKMADGRGTRWSPHSIYSKRLSKRQNRCGADVNGVHISATWRIRLNRSCAAAMRPYVILLWPLVLFSLDYFVLVLFAFVALVMVALWNRQTIIFFALWFLLSSSSFFPRLILAVADWMSAILPHMVWP